MEAPTPDDQQQWELRTACNKALQRFRTYRDMPRDQEEIKRLLAQYRHWFLTHCRTAPEIAAIVDRAVDTLRKRPAIAELAEIQASLRPPVNTETPLTPDEQREREAWRKRWYAEEQTTDKIAERKARFAEWREKHERKGPANREPLPLMIGGRFARPGEKPFEPVTQADVDRVLRELEANRNPTEES